MTYWEEHGDMGEPIIYGGYGSDANAVQPLTEDDKKVRNWHGGIVCEVDGKAYRSMREAAKAIGVTSSSLSKSLKRGMGQATVKGHKVTRKYI